MALHCTWMSCAFIAAAGPIRRWAQRPRVWRVVALGNSGAMTLYLWHIPAIAVTTFTLHALGFDAYDVHAPDYLGMLALREVVFVLVMAGAFTLFSPLEHRRLPWWDATPGATGPRSTAAGVLVCASGVALVVLAKNGLGDVAGWVPLTCVLAGLASARLCAASAGRATVPVSTRQTHAPH